MGTSIAEVTDDSATISDEEDPTGDTNSHEEIDSPRKTDFSPFREGEKVFAFHSGDLYEAKVLNFFLIELTLSFLLLIPLFLLQISLEFGEFLSNSRVFTC